MGGGSFNSLPTKNPFPTGLGEWPLFTIEGGEPGPFWYRTSYGCGGLAGWRAGVPLNTDGRYLTFDIPKLPGTKSYGTMQEALSALKALGEEGGLISAKQTNDVGTPMNFATYLGTSDEPYWEYVNHGWGNEDPNTATIIHNPKLPDWPKTTYFVIPGKSVRDPKNRSPISCKP